jgi:uncharacterized protein (TIGR03067 family)
MQVSVLVVTLALGAPALKDPPTKETGLVGEWELETVATGNNPPKPPRPKGAGVTRYVFTADGTWIVYRGERRLGDDRAYFTDPKSNPPAIDLRYEPAEQDGRLSRGIYKVEGDRLTLCVARGDQPRPKAFESSPDAPATIYIFRRANPKD